MSKARVRRRYERYRRYLVRCCRLGGYVPYRAYGRLLDRVWEE